MKLWYYTITILQEFIPKPVVWFLQGCVSLKQPTKSDLHYYFPTPTVNHLYNYKVKIYQLRPLLILKTSVSNISPQLLEIWLLKSHILKVITNQIKELSKDQEEANTITLNANSTKQLSTNTMF